ncbi:MAG TPA: serine hydrolase domain-containing protein [Polyangiaceae bacterium]
MRRGRGRVVGDDFDTEIARRVHELLVPHYLSLRSAAWLALLLSSLCACSNSSPNPDPPAGEPGDAELEALFAGAAEDGFVGAALVSVDGRRAYAKGFGLADRATDTPNTTRTAFDVGSLLKDFTAAAVYLLDEREILSVNDTLASVLPDVPDDKAEITLLQIIQHQAGFDTYHDTEGDFEPMTRSEARARILAQELLFEPGTDEEYSNAGYTLLADIVETVSEKAYTAFVHDELFAPAGMRESGFYSEELWQSVQTAVGYGSDTFGDNDPATWPYTWALVGNGGLVSTVEDLERWIIALEGGEILAPGTFERMRADYLELGAATLCGETVYAGAGAGDFGLGGVAVSAPGKATRILLASNEYDAFDIEEFAGDVASTVICRE